jgi:DNA primase
MVSHRDDLPRLIRERLDDPLELCTMLGLLERSKRQRGGVIVRCPVHEDSSPSCSITVGPDRTVRWRCFACSASGDALTLVASVYGLDVRLDFQRVLEAAADLAGIQIERSPSGERPKPIERPRPAPAPATEPEVDADTFAKVVAPLQHLGRLDGSGISASVCEYLDGRGLLAAARADGWFAVGPRSGEMLPDLFGVELLVRCGLTNERGQLKWAEHALAIPWRTPAGVVQTIQRRHLGTCEAAKRYVFPTGRGPAHPYGIEHLASRSPIGPIAIVEGAMDVLAKRRLDHLGWPIVLGSPGVSGWRAAWDELVADRVVRLAFDDDEAGNREAVKLADRFHAARAAVVLRSTPTRGKDWADGLRRTA